jgi:hypothetical protein
VKADTGQPATREKGSKVAIPWDIIERTCIAGVTFMDAAKEFEVKEDTIRKRARRYKWPVARAIRRKCVLFDVSAVLTLGKTG